MKRIQVLLVPMLLAVSCLYLSGCFVFEMDLKGEFIEELDWTLSADGVVTLNAETTNGKIEVTCADTKEIKVHAVKKIKAKTDELAEEYASDVTVYAEVKGDTAKVYYQHPKGWKKVQVAISYTIECPAQVAMQMQTTNGGVDMKGPEKNVDAKTTNGNIHLTGGHGVVTLRTTNGSVHVKDCQGELGASTTNGRITADMAAIKEKTHLTTTNGSVDITVHSGVAPIHVATTNGGVTVGLPADFSGQLDAGTFNGHISSDFAIPVKKPSKKSLKGPIGDGGDALVSIKTTNGGINIKKVGN